MGDNSSSHITVELTPAEAKAIVAALRQFEPYWPSDMDALSRAELLAEVQSAVAHVTSTLGPSVS